MNRLYGETCSRCQGFNNAEKGFVFSKDVLTRMLTEIYEGLNVKDNIQRDAFFETLRIFNKATDEGFADNYVSLEKEFIEAIRSNNEVFSAFRVHRMQNDMAEQLIDKDGKLKPFEKWMKDIETISDHYVRRWLETEYNTAVIRAQNAAEWKKFEAEADVVPNLRWMPTTSPTPDNLHRQYWSMKLTLPVNHPFWDKHRPGDRWNCKCWLKQTDEPESGSVEFDDLKPVEPVTGLDNNPGKDGKIFADSHPYYTEAYPGAQEAAQKIIKKTKLDTAFSEKITNQITLVEDEIRMNKNHETAVVIDKDGNILIDKRGAKYSVSFTKQEVEQMKDAILTHNHPRGWAFKENQIGRIGNSFSYPDIELAIVQDLAEIRAVTPLYTFSLKRPEKGWGVTNTVLKRYFNQETQKLRLEFESLIKKGYLSPETASAIHFHELWKRIAKHYQWDYQKLKTK